MILFLTIFSLFSCDSNVSNFKVDSEENISIGALELKSSSDIDNNNNSNLVKNRKMIWSANLKFQVTDVDSSTKIIQKLSKDLGGFVSKMDLKSTNYEIKNTIKIRIANENFEKLINDFKQQAIFIDEFNIQSKDVTEEFIDIESRLKTKKEVRERYIDVLRNKAGKVSEIIEAEEAIRKITEEIEAKEGRLRYLKDRVSFSTIILIIYQKVKFKMTPETYEKPYFKKLTNSLKNGWCIITTFILFLANIWPLLLIGGLIMWKGKWMINKIKK
ncbi:MAG: DUF4349 domain-containing protein [Flavobacteriaceae bacterium]|nr:DUF4349 domain-containing protein [Flavobacteriaceae bacterium]